MHHVCARKFIRKNFKAIAEIIGTKTEAHVRNFFVTYKKKYNLDVVLKEFEAENGLIDLSEEKDEKNGILNKTILEKTLVICFFKKNFSDPWKIPNDFLLLFYFSNELDIIQEKIIELTKNKYFWNGGIIKVASLCAKIPVACICTVGSLLLPFPSYRI